MVLQKMGSSMGSAFCHSAPRMQLGFGWGARLAIYGRLCWNGFMVIILLLIVLCLTPVGAVETWWRCFGEIQVGDFAGGHHEAAGKDPADLKVFLKQDKFDEWVTHEDEFVRISYPKHPLLKLEVQGGDAGIEVEGGVCTTVDNSFQKAYVLKAGSATYGVFLLSPAQWLDDGICFCGPMVHDVYRVEDGCLARFSLLPGGAVKKVQLLGGKLRLMAFEWTHLACPRDIYEEMVERMTLKIPHHLDEAALCGEIKRRYGPVGLSGLIHPGVTLAAANVIMGSEAKVEDGIATWLFDANDYHKALRATLKDGVIVALLDQGPTLVSEDPIEGSLRWADKLIEAMDDAEAKPSEKQVSQFTAAVLKAAIAPDSPERQWQWLPLLEKLVCEYGARDPAIADTVLRLGKGKGGELRILVHLNHPDIAAWIISNLQKMAVEEPSKTSSNGFSSPVAERASDAVELLEWLMKNGRSADAVFHLKALVATGEPAWLHAATESAPSLPADFAQAVIRQALETAIKHRDGELVELAFVSIGLTSLSDPASLIPLVESIPDAEPGSDWAKAKKQALADLRAPKPGR